ncbi:MAG: hypothetical protein HQM16_16755 [Deltaproteobacteria bacterium]|nr:hypothetical protein [Deltaproteobacteria bacterium]
MIKFLLFEILIVHYDSYAVFDYTDFLNHIHHQRPDGLLTTCNGFNPCDLNSSDFGRVSVRGQQVNGVYEKQALREGQVTAAGCYYFSAWQLFKNCAMRYLQEVKESGRRFYVSEVYNEMLKEGRVVVSYPVKRFISFGRPHDVLSFKYWERVFLTPPIPSC